MFAKEVATVDIVCSNECLTFKTPPKSDWGSLKRLMVSREGFATFNTRGRLQRLTSTLGALTTTK